MTYETSTTMEATDPGCCDESTTYEAVSYDPPDYDQTGYETPDYDQASYETPDYDQTGIDSYVDPGVDSSAAVEQADSGLGGADPWADAPSFDTPSVQSTPAVTASATPVADSSAPFEVPTGDPFTYGGDSAAGPIVDDFARPYDNSAHQAPSWSAAESYAADSPSQLADLPGYEFGSGESMSAGSPVGFPAATIGADNPFNSATMVGDPTDAQFWFKQNGAFSCVPSTVSQILSDFTGQVRSDEFDVAARSQQLGTFDEFGNWKPLYDPASGVSSDLIDDILDDQGLPSTMHQNQTFADIETYLSRGQGVIMVVDGKDLLPDVGYEDAANSDEPENSATDYTSHAIRVVGIDRTRGVAVLADPAYEGGGGVVVPLDRLEEAWNDLNWTPEGMVRDHRLIVTDDVDPTDNPALAATVRPAAPANSTDPEPNRSTNNQTDPNGSQREAGPDQSTRQSDSPAEQRSNGHESPARLPIDDDPYGTSRVGPQEVTLELPGDGPTPVQTPQAARTVAAPAPSKAPAYSQDMFGSPAVAPTPLDPALSALLTAQPLDTPVDTPVDQGDLSAWVLLPVAAGAAGLGIGGTALLNRRR